MKYTLCILFLSGIVCAADFPTGAQIELITDFSNGLNTITPANKLAKGFSPNLRNVFIHRNPGKIIKRNGFIQIGVATNTLTSGRFMTIFNKENGGKEYIVSDDSIVLTTQDFNAYVVISSGLNQGAHIQSKQIRNKIWFTNGSNSVFTWDGLVMQRLDGTNGTPNVPKFKFIEVFQERVFGLNTSADGSSLDWSDVASTAGVAIAPDSYLAWPAINHTSVGRGDGQVGTSEWYYSGQLQIGKERSIYTLYGTNTSNYNARKTESWVGPSSQDSIAILDDLTYFKGFDGIYSYDGGKAVRISDAISSDMDSVLDVQTKFVINIWNTKPIFDQGQYNQSISSASNVVKLFKGRTVSVGKSSPNSSGTTIFIGAVTSYYLIPDVSSLSQWLNSENFVYVQKVRAPINTGALTVSARIRATLYNTFTGVEQSTVATVNNPPGNYVDFTFSSHSFVFNNQDILQGSMTFKLEWDNKSEPLSAGSVIQSPEDAGFGANLWNFTLAGETTGQYISNVATNTTITSWQSFDANSNTNGGNINYFIRSATSVVNITTQTWLPISPGVVIPFSTLNTFVQWASTLTAPVDFSGEPEIESVIVNHTEGISNGDRPFAVVWNKEYWLSISTEGSGKFSLQYVKAWNTNSNPNAWNKMDSMNLRSFVADGKNSLYGGSASTGAFYRLDYGTNDNGAAIDAFFETQDLILKGGLTGGYDGNWMEEQLHELWIDADGESGNTLRVGLSVNGGAFTERTFDLTGSGRQLKIDYMQSKFGSFFRLRPRNNQLDKGLNLINMAIIYQPLKTRPK